MGAKERRRKGRIKRDRNSGGRVNDITQKKKETDEKMETEKY